MDAALEQLLSQKDALGVARSLGLAEAPLEASAGFWQGLWGAHSQGLAASELRWLAQCAAASPFATGGLAALVDLWQWVDLPVADWDQEGSTALAGALAASQACMRYVRGRPAIAVGILGGAWLRQAKPPEVMRDELRDIRITAGVRGYTVDPLREGLAAYRVAEWVRIVARQFGLGAPIDEVLQEISDLAESIIDAATRWHLRRDRSQRGPRREVMLNGDEREAGFCVVAQGKLGARELNLSSDIDLQFFYSGGRSPKEASQSLHERFVHVARAVSQTLSAKTAVGPLYRVDLDLRPEGSKGALANSLNAAESYYETWGQTWERLALLRARHMAGASWVTVELLKRLDPFRYPRSVDAQLIQHVRQMAGRVQEAQVRRAARGLRRHQPNAVDLKLSRGCIRDIEFFTQTLQLLFGGKRVDLRQTSLIQGLERLYVADRLTRREHRTLLRSYRFLRQLENAVQALEERQTQQLPTAPETLRHLGIMLGMHGQAQVDADAEHGPTKEVAPAPEVLVQQMLDRTRQSVKRVCAPLFEAAPLKLEPQEASPTANANATANTNVAVNATATATATAAVAVAKLGGHSRERLSKRARLAVLALNGSSRQERCEALEALGFAASAEALGLVEILQHRLGGPLARRDTRRWQGLGPVLLQVVADSPDPMQSLRLWVDLDDRLRRFPGYYHGLLSSPLGRRRLFDLLSASTFLGQVLIRYPELTEWLSAPRRELAGGDEDTPTEVASARSAMLEALGRRLGLASLPHTDVQLPASTDSDDDDDGGAKRDPHDVLELRLRSIRRYHLQETLRIGLQDLEYNPVLENVFAPLTALAGACLEVILELAFKEVERLRGESLGRHLAVLGLGRMGSGEMGYGSDLDLVFIYDEAQKNLPRDAAIKVTQKLIQMLTIRYPEGLLYNIDTRLRPSGAQGALVSSAAGFVGYHQGNAQLWEHQALLRAQPVAGDEALGKRVLAALQDKLYPAALRDDARKVFHSMRMRIERERAPTKKDAFNVKTGRGGISDVLFIVQYLTMKHGRAHPELRQTAILGSLRVLGQVGELRASELQRLERAYRFLRFLENRLRIATNGPIEILDLHEGSLTTLARRMGYSAKGVQKLHRDYGKITSQIRTIYNRVFGVSAG